MGQVLLKLKAYVGTIVVVLGLISASVTILMAAGDIGRIAQVAAVVILVIIAAIFAIWFVLGPAVATIRANRGLAELTAFMQASAPYYICPATEDDILWISTTAKHIYSGIDVIPHDTMLEWYRVNRNGFWVIKSGNGHIVGNLDVLPLKPATFAKFIKGEIIEREIYADGLYPHTERTHITNLYVESFVALDRRGRPNGPAAVQVIEEFPQLVHALCHASQVERVYALAASPNGRQITEHLGFSRIREGANRRDGHDLYCVGFPDLARNISNILGKRLRNRELIRMIIADEGGPTL